MKRSLPNVVVAAAALVLGAAVYSAAWFSDDALRLWRISLDWARFGSPDLNPGHRLLEFSQPLWVAILAAVLYLGAPAAAAVVALQFVLFVGAVALLWACHRRTLAAPGSRSRIPGSAAKVAALAILLAASNGFREYIASGLEYALCFLATAALAYAVLRFEEEGPGGAGRAIGLAALCESILALSSVDMAIALAPLALVPALRCRASVIRHWRAAALGWLPLAAWAAYGVLHYGTFLSVRPSAKLMSSLPWSDAFAHGTLYILSGLIEQPFTFLLVASAIASAAYSGALARRATPSILLAGAAVVDLGIVAWTGGDPVAGRMFCPAAILSAAAIASAPALPLGAYALIACLGGLFFDTGKISLLHGRASRVPRTVELFREWGIADDYNLQKARPAAALAALGQVRLSRWNPAAPVRTLVSDAPGWDGVAAGPGVVIVDAGGIGPPRPELRGVLATTLRFSAAPAGTLEPVVAFGGPADGTLVMAERLPASAVRFQIWTPGSVPLFSRAIVLSSAGPHRLVVAYGSAVAGRVHVGRFAVMLDGVLLKDVDRPARRYSFEEIVPGWNVQANPSCALRFAGDIGSLLPAGADDFGRGRWATPLQANSVAELRVRFSRLTNSAEPIAVTGAERAGDIVFVRRVGAGRVVFGHEHWGQAPTMGPVTAVDDDKIHVLRVALGPLFSASDGILAPNGLRVTMDGAEVLRSRQALYPFRADEACLLDNPLAGSFCGRDFLGDVDGMSTISLEPLLASTARILAQNTGPVTLGLRFDGCSTGTGLGLLEKGAPGAGDVVYVIMTDRSHARFYFDHWGFGGLAGPEVAVDPAADHVLRIEMGSLQRPGAAPRGVPALDRLTLDGRVVLEGRVPSASADDGPIRIAGNFLKSSNVGIPFDGTCVSVERGAGRVQFSY